MQIEGITHATILSIMSEVGQDGFQKFATAKQFSSWLRLALNNKISGEKVLVTRCLRVVIALKLRFVMPQNAVGNLKESHLSHFFKRIAFKKGRAAALSATARKLGVIIYKMVTKKMPCKSPNEYMFLDQKRKL